MFPQDVACEVALVCDGLPLAAARTEPAPRGGGAPVWAGRVGTCVVFELTSADGAGAVDLAPLALEVRLWSTNVLLDDELIAVGRIEAVAAVVDGLPRDVRLERPAPTPSLLDHLFGEAASVQGEAGEATSVQGEAAPLNPFLDNDAPSAVTLSVHCDALGAAAEPGLGAAGADGAGPERDPQALAAAAIVEPPPVATVFAYGPSTDLATSLRAEPARPAVYPSPPGLTRTLPGPGPPQ